MNNTKEKLILSQDGIITIMMYVFAGIGVVFSQVNLFTLGLVSICMLLLAFNGKIIYVYPLSILLNDALGSIPGGFSVYYIFIICYMIDRIKYQTNYQANTTKTVCILLAIAVNAQMFFTGAQSLQRLIIILFTLIWSVEIIDSVIKKNQINMFLNVYILTVIYSIFLSVVKGAEMVSAGAYGNQISRAGLIGHGSAGDPNIAGFTIVVAIICTMFIKKPFLNRAVVLTALLFGLIRTVSLSNIGVAVVSVFLYSMLKAKYENKTSSTVIKVLFSFSTILLILSVLYRIAPFLNFQALNSLIDRINEAFNLINMGDYNDLSSGRVDIQTNAMTYFSNQSLFKKLFGGNSAYILGYATHNTYMEHLLRFGIIGFLVLLIVGLQRFISVIKHSKSQSSSANYTAGILTLKITTIIFIFTLSVNSGIPLIYWLLILYYL